VCMPASDRTMEFRMVIQEAKSGSGRIPRSIRALGKAKQMHKTRRATGARKPFWSVLVA